MPPPLLAYNVQAVSRSMTSIRIRPILAAVALAATLLATHSLWAQSSGGSYTMRKQVIGAGAVAAAGSYRLTGTVAEPGAAQSASTQFRLTGGFHTPRSGGSIFCDGFENAACP